MLSIHQRLVQKQIQSPQQVLLSSLLQLPLLKFEQRLKMEIEANPLLELSDEVEMEQDLEENQEQALKEEKLEDNNDDSEDSGEKDSGDAVEDIDKHEDIDDTDWEAILGDDGTLDTRAPRDNSAEVFERTEVATTNLSEHLLEQLHLLNLSPEANEIGEYVIWNINEMGYLGCEVSVIAHNLDVSEDEVENVLEKIQRFDPVGIGARNLQECLLIQLQEQTPPDKLTIEIIRDHFEDFSNRRYERIIKKLDMDDEDMRGVIEAVTHLNPKPGDGYVSFADSVVVPDLAIVRKEDEFEIVMNDWNIPNLRINNSYKTLLLDKKSTSRETKDFVRKRLESARWLINSIHQRRMTILKVVEKLIEKQYDFFDRGKEYIRPMILKDIADEINMDISTVSRVTNGKYVQTEYGVFELKYFFSEGIKTDSGEDVSNRRVKQLIKEIIDKEEKKKPLNDQKIADMLNEQGYTLARRTVAKYREQMDIPVSRLRKGL
ncbi:MAG: RNA polymerase factor sigma-54 [Deferribacteres bacterium]|nr:RNA polymerase factor sigma-54 [candidate division KSB1 bacterium]MCB9502685.1 RNA polymerase factor sigma-54 [Deferribacteres bacterium]